jgi:type II secretory pathway component PulM
MSELLARYSQREKMIVLAALLVIVVIGFHSLVIEPYQMRVVELQEELEQQRADLDWMTSAVANMPSKTAAPDTVKIDGTLANFVDQAVRSQGLSSKLKQMSPVGDTGAITELAMIWPPVKLRLDASGRVPHGYTVT